MKISMRDIELEEDGLITYKNRIYIPNVAYLRRVVMDEIHQAPYSGTKDILRQWRHLESNTFVQE